MFRTVKKPIEENRYLNTYNAKLSTSEHSRDYLLHREKQVCGVGAQTREKQEGPRPSSFLHHKTG